VGGVKGDNSTAFHCTAICPSEIPHKILSQDGNDEQYCSNEPVGPSFLLGETDNRLVIVVTSTVFAVVFVVFVAAIFVYWHQRVKAKANAVKMKMALTGLEDNEPLQPTNVKPNLTKLWIVKEPEIRKGGILGRGAFGTVFKGVWVPEGKNVKIPVAIKVLHVRTGADTNKDLLEETLIMATVEHPNLLKLLAVCMTSQMMLVTQLMPLGCLLDYVRNNRDKIGSKPLLNWCTQIAKGQCLTFIHNTFCDCEDR
jgi:L1 cell adhesion molecule